jgi:hypothetical protein
MRVKERVSFLSMFLRHAMVGPEINRGSIFYPRSAGRPAAAIFQCPRAFIDSEPAG